MTTQQNDARKRADREHVKFAASLTAPVEKVQPLPPKTAATADSSGFVDISAFSASDSEWVERALAKARGEEPAPKSAPPKPIPTVRGMLLAPPTLAPVALSSLVDAQEKARSRAKRPARIALACAIAAFLAAGLVTLRRPSPLAITTSFAMTARADALAFVLVPPPVVVDPAPVAAPVPAAPSASVTATTKPATAKAPPPRPVLGAAPPPMRATPIPPPKSAGTPSLEEMMRRAAQSPPKKK